MSEEFEHEFLNVVDARTHVFLQSFIGMTNPLRQLRIEADELQQQWVILCRGRKEAFEPDHNFEYLDKDCILEYGLDDPFVKRSDCASFAHEFFTPTLELNRFKRAIEGFRELFMRRNIDQSLKETIHSLITINLALAARHSIVTTGRVTAQDIKALCNSDSISLLSKVISTNDGNSLLSQVTSTNSQVIDEAVRVSNNDKLLKNLHNKTMKRVIEHMSQKLEKYSPPDPELVKEFTEMRDDVMKLLYADQPEDNDTEDQEDDDDEEEEEEEEEEEPDVSSAPSQNQRQSHEEGGRRQSSYPSPTVSAEGDVPNVNEKPTKRPAARALDNGMDIDQRLRSRSREATSSTGAQKVRPAPAFTPLRKPPVRQAAVGKGKQVKRGADAFDDDNTGSTSSARRTTRRTIKDDDPEYQDEFNTDSSDTLETPPPLRELLNRTGSSCMNEDARAGSSSTIRQSMTMSPPIQPAKKQRKQTVHWTSEEVKQLERLVPKFKYSEEDIVVKKRDHKWSQLKKYDQEHGNILRHRTAEHLKDKYRDLCGHRPAAAAANRRSSEQTTPVGGSRLASRTPSIF